MHQGMHLAKCSFERLRTPFTDHVIPTVDSGLCQALKSWSNSGNAIIPGVISTIVFLSGSLYVFTILIHHFKMLLILPPPILWLRMKRPQNRKWGDLQLCNVWRVILLYSKSFPSCAITSDMKDFFLQGHLCTRKYWWYGGWHNCCFL